MISFRTGRIRVGVLLMIVLSATFLASCDSLFVSDGDSDQGITAKGGYFYFIDNTTLQVLMLDRNLRVLKAWDTQVLFGDTRLQGLTFDGKYLWLSAAGSYDEIVQVDATGDTLKAVLTLDAPPEARGTIRDICWDGEYLWAVNSGSETYATPATLYRLDAATGGILFETPLPSPEPRALTYVGENGDAYGRGIASGIYYADVEHDCIYTYSTIKQLFDSVMASPEPPRGADYIFPVGLTFDGEDLWLVNSSSAGDHLYRINRKGLELERVELPYVTPGPIIWATYDIRLVNPPTINAVSPNAGSRGASINVTILGADFQDGTITVSFGAGITVSNVAFVDAGTVTATIDIAADAEFGPRTVTLTNPDGQSGLGDALFTVSEVDPLAGYLWLTDPNNDVMYKIKISDTTIVQQWDLLGVGPGGSSQGLTFDGTNVWLCDGGTNDKIIKLDTDGENLAILDSYTAPPNAEGIAREIAFDGTNMWCANSGTDYIYRLNITTGAILDSIPTPGDEIRGIVFANGNLYANDRIIDSVFVYNTGTGTWTAQFATPIPPEGDEGDRYATGMTWDGLNFWIVNSTYEFDYLFQVTTDGTVLITYEVPNRGDAQPSGILFTQE
ncbi:MAG: IPT/TIG domain-containing protein [candidate division Zixibacteria bacterium]|nr:IPT/TIG domain-containing protein [candidate division Zixibacteria bacterium]